MDALSLALIKVVEQKAESAVSGVENITAEGTNLVFHTKDGNSINVQVPIPKDGVSIVNVVVDEYNHLICLLSDGNLIDAGEITLTAPEGAAGTSNYNKLLNIPIKNLNGTVDNPILLSDLDRGSYTLTGYYKYNSIDKIKNIDYKINVDIYKDVSNEFNKVARFESFEDGKFYSYFISFYSNGTCLQNKIRIDEPENGTIFISEDSLPTVGQENILYITENSLLQWIDGAYINMNEPRWGSL